MRDPVKLVCPVVGRFSRLFPLLFPLLFLLGGVVPFLSFGNAWADGSAVITIGEAQGDVGEDVSIPVSLATNGTQPAAISFEIPFDAQSLAFKSASPGAAAKTAVKEVDTNVAADGSLHILLFGGTTVVGDGVLLTAVFTVLSVGNESRPLNGENLRISDPNAADIPGTIVAGAVRGNCAAPPAPTDVAASQGNPDGVEVSWSPVEGAAAYRVYRRDPATPADVVSISDWLPGTSFVDTTAVAPTAGQAGCAGPGQPNYVTYEYLVSAKNGAGCASAFSEPAQGYRGQAAAALATVLPAFSRSSFLGDLIAWVSAMGVLCLSSRWCLVMNAIGIGRLNRGLGKI